MRKSGYTNNWCLWMCVCLLPGLWRVVPCLSTQASSLPKAPRNVILITISSLRAGHVGCFGYKRNTTPHFDAFARANVLFLNAYAPSSWMMPAHGSIFTSLYPSEHGATHIYDKKLEGGRRTLAEILADGGYYCAGFCCSPYLTSEAGFAQGFHSYDDFSVPMLLAAMETRSDEPVNINRRRTNDLINGVAIKWLEKNTRTPFFLFVHYYDNHWDYCPSPPYAEMFDPNYKGSIDGTQIAREPLYSNRPSDRDVEHMVALYDGEVRQTDEDVGQMLACLKSKGLFENSIVVILGDHGEQFYEHGNTSHHGLYDEMIRVPLAISLPEMSGRPRVLDGLVSEVDLLPTILGYLGLPLPEPCRGMNVLPLILGGQGTARPYVLAEYTGGAVEDVFAIRSTRYKCYQKAGGRLFAYDLSVDPEEQRRLSASQFNQELQELAGTLTCWTKTLIKEAPNVTPGR